MKEEQKVTGKKSGRPTSDPKTHDIRVRVNDTMYEKVRIYSQEHDQTITDTVRQAIDGYLPEQ